MNQIALITKFPELITELKLLLPDIPIYELTLPDEKDKLNDFEILIMDCDTLGANVSQIKRPKWVHTTWAGVEKVMEHIDPNNPPPFALTRHCTEQMFEYVVAQIINVERGLYEFHDKQQKKNWTNRMELQRNYRTIEDLTVGVLGLGAIGGCVAKGLSNLGAKVIGCKRTEAVTPELSFLAKIYSASRLPEMLKECDYIVNVLPRTAETDDLLSDDVLENCKRGAIFMNIGRGNVIKDRDLIKALNKKWICAAVLDVLEVEPPVQDSPLWTMPQVYITPHIAGTIRGKDVAKSFAENYNRYKTGAPLQTLVRYSSGY